MTVTNELEYVFRPRSIAVVGAHDTRGGLAGVTKLALQRAEAVGATFYPINPKLDSVYGHATYPSLRVLPEPVDLLVILTSRPAEILDDAGDARPRFTLVFASGFSETGRPEDLAREHELVAAAERAGTRLIGPNTNGNAMEALKDLPGRKIALIAQSGHQGRPVAQAQDLGVGMSYWAPTGNEVDLEGSDFAAFFAADPDTAAIAAYIEGFKSGQRLREAAIAGIEHETPMVVMKVGRSEVGAKMALSHTGHLAGADEVYDAFFEQFGIHRVDDVDELIEVSAAIARAPLPTADGIAILTISGGTAAALGDLAMASGLSFPELRPETQAALHEIIPETFRVSNPVDNGGNSMREGQGHRMLELILEDPSIGLVIFPITGVAAGLTDAIGEAILKVHATATKPIVVIWSAPTTDHPLYQELWDAGLPMFRNFRNAISGIKALLAHPGRTPELAEVARLARRLPELPMERHGATVLDEADATAWLSERGVPFARSVVATTPDEAVRAAAGLGGATVVVKARGVAHKTERGLVAVGLGVDEDVRSAAARMLAEPDVDEVLVAEQVDGGIELLVGIAPDPVLGPVVVVGAGGVTAEAFGDVSRSVLPITPERARRMVEELRVAPLLRGWRGAPGADVDAVVDLILRLADLAATEPIIELDINPVLARPDGLVALDALLTLGDAVALDEGEPLGTGDGGAHR